MLGLGQMVTTIVILLVGKGTRIITFPSFSRNTARKVIHLYLYFFVNS